MSSDSTARQVIPDRKTPYVLGVLNVIFGTLLCGLAVLLAIATIASAFVNPIIEQVTAAAVQQAQAERAEQLARVDELRQQAAEADDEARRTELEDEAAGLEARVGPEPPNLAELMKQAQANKWINFGVPALKYSTSLLVNGLLIYWGVGLMGLRESARRATIGLAWVKIARLALIAAIELGVVVPLQLKVQFETQKAVQVNFGPGGGPQQMPPDAQRFMTIMTTVAAFTFVGGFALVGCVYPVLLLWMLTRPRVKLAFQLAEAGALPAPA